MSERDMRRLLQWMEGEEQDPDEFEADMSAWNHAVLIKDYIGMFRSGIGLTTTIYGTPYDSDIRPLNEPEYSDHLAELHRFLTDNGLETVKFDKPILNDLFPQPAPRNTDLSAMFVSTGHDGTRLAYQQKFLDLMYGWGYRDIIAIGTAGYLSKVPDQLSLLTFCAPDGTKSFVSQDGYVATGYDLEPDYERPLSQRGGYGRFPTSWDSHQFKDVTSQLGFLVDHLDRFEFQAGDLLGYRPKEMTETGIANAWDGWTGSD